MPNVVAVAIAIAIATATITTTISIHRRTGAFLNNFPRKWMVFENVEFVCLLLHNCECVCVFGVSSIFHGRVFFNGSRFYFFVTFLFLFCNNFVSIYVGGQMNQVYLDYV